VARSRRRLRAGDAGRCSIIGFGPLLHSAFLYFSKYSLLDLWHFNGVVGGGDKDAGFGCMCCRE